ncbi:MAG: hypothetical protein QHH15_00450 [Candidatus Thermoplasmatota archaeon]|nr:hypothetical protein [Candidatus Thermoplasmatota archaeon]MDH7506244.1 hypothetical protein [Candidatus Thermoplasmatota archaeon]
MFKTMEATLIVEKAREDREIEQYLLPGRWVATIKCSRCGYETESYGQGLPVQESQASYIKAMVQCEKCEFDDVLEVTEFWAGQDIYNKRKP